MVCDGLTGLPAAIEAVWPDAIVQTCIVHLTRASLRWVNYKDRKKVAAALRLIYAAPTEQAARDALDAWTDSEVGRPTRRSNANGKPPGSRSCRSSPSRPRSAGSSTPRT